MLLRLRRFPSVLSLLLFVACASKAPLATQLTEGNPVNTAAKATPTKDLGDGRLTERERLQLTLARMHFDNGDFDLARKEYVRLVLNHPSSFVKEVAQFMIGESFYKAQDCAQAERYFQHYVAEFPTGYRRAESDVRLQQCQEQRQKMEAYWTEGKMRQLEQQTPPAETPPLPPAAPELPHNRRSDFRTTYYWIENESDYEPLRMQSLLGVDNKPIAQVPEKFLKRLLVEGTGRLRNGQVVNWAAPKRFKIVDATSPYGLGAQGRALIPYRTLAVDTKLIRLGTVLYIKEFDGVTLASGEKHDGCFVAGDVGSAIQGLHIDLFAPSYNEALQLMQQAPENVPLRQPAPHCLVSYALEDGYSAIAGSRKRRD